MMNLLGQGFLFELCTDNFKFDYSILAAIQLGISVQVDLLG